MVGIYLVTNKINGHQYVGQSIDIKRRWVEHKCPSNIANDRTINKAYRKYGFDNFDYQVIEECSEEMLDEREKFWINKLHPVYNMNEGGVGNKGHHHSESTKKILSFKSKTQWENSTEEEKAKRIANNLKGQPKGHKVSLETRDKLRLINLGKKHSEETKRKMSMSKKGKNDNKSHFKTVIAIKNNDAVAIFFSVRFAGEYLNIHPSSITKVLKGERKTASNYNWKYWSVETMADECKPVGASLSRIEVRGIRKDEEIVRTTKMENLWVFDKGLIELAERSGQFKNIIDEVVYEGQLVKKNKFTGEYEFDEDAKTSDKVVGYMARMDLVNGFSKTIFWTIEEVEAHAKKFSQAFRSNFNSPWKTDFDAMARKTVLKALFSKYAPKSVAMQEAIKFDQSVIKVNENLNDEDLVIDAFDAEYVDNQPQAVEVNGEVVDPEKDLFGEPKKGGKK